MVLFRTSLFTLLLFIVYGTNVTAQETKFNRFSVALSTGVHIPLSLQNGKSSSDYIAFKQYQVAGRYMISDKYGLKAFYGYNQFNDPEDSQSGFTFYRIGAEGVANLSKLLKVNYRVRERFVLLVHGGAGLSFAKLSSQGGTDRIGNFLLGLTGEVKLNKHFSLLADATYLANLKQHHFFDGTSLPNNNFQTGSFMNLSVGLLYSFGSREHHADWY